MSKLSKLDEDKGIVYSNRVLLGNWYEASKLEEHKLQLFRNQMEKGDLMLARYRKMTENLNAPSALTQSTGNIAFGDKIALMAPHVSVAASPSGESKSIFLGGRISADDIMYSQDLCDGCALVCHQDLKPTAKHTFVITSADYCDRKQEVLKYNQEFLLTLAKSEKTKPLYVRFDPNAIPGVCGKYPLYLSDHAVSNTRWRIQPVQVPHITRFEQEGKPVPTNEDIVINHCATNLNLGVDIRKGGTGFYGKIKFHMFLDPLRTSELMLMKYRMMNENLNRPSELTHSFGDKIALLAPHVPATRPSRDDAKGVLWGGKLNSDELIFTQDLHDGCPMVTFPDLQPKEKTPSSLPVNTDIIINHCATNINLGVNSEEWMPGFFEKIRNKANKETVVEYTHIEFAQEIRRRTSYRP